MLILLLKGVKPLALCPDNVWALVPYGYPHYNSGTAETLHNSFARATLTLRSAGTPWCQHITSTPHCLDVRHTSYNILQGWPAVYWISSLHCNCGALFVTDWAV